MKPQIIICLFLVILTAGCKPGDYNGNLSLNVRDASPEEKARAYQIQVEADKVAIANASQRARDEIDTYTYQQTAAQNVELSRQQREAEIKAQTAKTTAEINAAADKARVESDVTLARGEADVYAIQVAAQANADRERKLAEAMGNGVMALGYGVMLMTGGLAAAFVVFSMGRSAAHVRHAWAMSEVLLIQSERGLPPLLITRGYLIDTLTGERARLSDVAGVSTLRLAAMTRLLETRALAAAASDIGKSNRGRQSGGVDAARVLSDIPASVPQLIEAGQ